MTKKFDFSLISLVYRFNLAYACACHKPGSHVVVFFLLWPVRFWEVIGCFIDIGGIVDHHVYRISISRILLLYYYAWQCMHDYKCFLIDRKHLIKINSVCIKTHQFSINVFSALFKMHCKIINNSTVLISRKLITGGKYH